MNEKEKLSKFLKGTSTSLNALSKEVSMSGIDGESLDLMKKIGSELLFKGCAIGFKEVEDE